MVVIGSSPLTRGTLAFDDASYSAARSIPAYAGNSAQGKARNLLRSVHPRLRGELAVVTAQRIVKSGSSPITRGTRENSSPHEFHGRFIPAYAGNSGRPMSPLEANTVHPRLRGELSNPEVCRGRTGGSSPLTRGTQEFTQEQSEVRRFIPAYAGNSLKMVTTLH